MTHLGGEWMWSELGIKDDYTVKIEGPKSWKSSNNTVISFRDTETSWKNQLKDTEATAFVGEEMVKEESLCFTINR